MQIFTRDRDLTPSWELLPVSIQLLRKNVWPVVYLSFIPGLLLTVGVVLFGDVSTKQLESPTYHMSSHSSLGMALIAVSSLWILLAYPGYLLMQVRAIRGEEPEPWESFKRGLPRLFPLLWMVIIASLLIAIGSLLIIPALFLLRGFILAPYYVTDQKFGPWQALKASYHDSRPVTAWIWGVIGIILVFVCMEASLDKIPIVGRVISIVIGYAYSFALAIRYTQITNTTKGAKRHEVQARS